jgi:hypothetical protein
MTLQNLDMAMVGALIGDPARANILAALMDGRALTAPELAYMAGVAPQTASGHPIMTVAAVQVPPRARTVSRIDEHMCTARTCYDHIAGRLGVGMADALVERGQIVLTEDGGEITEPGAAFFSSFGIELAVGRKSHRAFCRPCLDWSERRPHIAGAIGAALCRRCLDLGWIERRRDTRALAITGNGQRGFADAFGVQRPRQP